ncbi:serine hydrolase [Bowmanella sp. JS7-9]|uniref:Serine hydrolase domain-containing protein n=1 Tax=Pseudobowmanella zhangzhouensis TaxID=1537679 RepID=A0ABW1XMP6_9ALTE|nr:serine hydrolase [Bowmanella sp. JS7-9]TBX20572.1 beta-lactamase class C [Bowmanella sp. JS7-9]
MQSGFRWSRIGLLVLVIGACYVAWQWPLLVRLYKVVTLYDEDKIVNNFLHMEDAFPTKVLQPSSNPQLLTPALAELPAQFEFDGHMLDTQAFLADSRTTGLIVLKDAQILYEHYWQGMSDDSTHMSFSLAKSFLSALIGIAVEEGAIGSIEEPVTRYAPELKGSGYDGVRIKDVLQMSSGVGFNEDYGDFFSDINRFSRTVALGQPFNEFATTLQREFEPGTYNQYVSIDTQVLGMVLVNATGKPLTEYLQEKIWQPAGMASQAYYLTDFTGMELALGGLNVTLRDYARFGLLYLHNGQRDGLQIVPSHWIHDSVTADAPHLQPGDNPASKHKYGYGYQWWLPDGRDDEYQGQGIYGQYIVIDPDKHIVIVKTSANHRYNDQSLRWQDKHQALFRAISQYYSE